MTVKNVTILVGIGIEVSGMTANAAKEEHKSRVHVQQSILTCKGRGEG